MYLRFEASGTLTSIGTKTDTTIIADPFLQSNPNKKLFKLVDDFLLWNETEFLVSILAKMLDSFKQTENNEDSLSDARHLVSQLIKFSINANEAIKEVKNG